MSEADTLISARRAFRKGSKSFAAAALLFARETRRDATLLYAWCRHCDDVIDGQTLGFGHRETADTAEDRLTLLYVRTAAVFEGGAVEDAPFIGLREVARRHDIPHSLVREHLDGYRMDVEARHYETIEDTLQYCYHVAGVVGLMMARVMGVRDAGTLGRACDLGIAFQLTNIARDLVEDACNGRVYLPATWLAEAGIGAESIARAARARTALAARLIGLSEGYYTSARIGIGALPFRSAWAISTARAVYRRIGTQILDRGERAWQQRVRTSRRAKTALIARGVVEALGRRRLLALATRAE